MAGISFRNDAVGIWIVAGWGFRQIINDLKSNYILEQDILAAITEAEHVGVFHVWMLDQHLQTIITVLLEQLCIGILDGSLQSIIPDSYNDAETRAAYRQGVVSLLETIRAIKDQ